MKIKSKLFITLIAVLLCTVMAAFISACNKGNGGDGKGDTTPPPETQIISASGFEFDKTGETTRLYCDVSNTTEYIDLSSKITVSENCTWKLYKDFTGTNELILKSMSLEIGHNKAYIIVFETSDKFTRYEVDIYRLDMKSYTFKNEEETHASGTIQEKSELAAPEAPKRTGYTFTGWAVEGTTTIVQFPYAVTENITFVAQYTPINYTITYHLNGGENDNSNPDSYNIETADITLANATRAGYRFDGWYSDDGFGTQVTKIALGSYGDKILYAKWTINTYTITYHLYGGENNSNNPDSYDIETPDITLLSPLERRGYTFGGWYSDEHFNTQVTVIELGSWGDKDIYCKWEAIVCTITYNLDGGENDEANPASYTIETPDITLANATRRGYTFKGWYTDNPFNTKIEVIETALLQNYNLYAVWEIDVYTVNYIVEGGTNPDNTVTEFTVNDLPITLNKARKNDAIFIDWHLNSIDGDVITEIDITESIVLYARFLEATNLTYELSDDESYYIMNTVNGNATDINGIETVIIPEYHNDLPVKSIIGLLAIESIKTLVIPDTVTFIGENVLFAQNVVIYYCGTKEQWDNIEFEGYWIKRETLKYYYSDEYPYNDEVTTGNFWHFDENNQLVIWEKKDI